MAAGDQISMYKLILILALLSLFSCKKRPKTPSSPAADAIESTSADQYNNLRAFDPKRIEFLESCDVSLAPPSPLRKLTNQEIINTLEDSFQIDLKKYRDQLPAEIASEGFRSTVSSTPTSAVFIRSLSQVSGEISREILASPLLSELRKDCDDNLCIENFVRKIADILFVRPLSTESLATFRTVYLTVSNIEGNSREDAQKSTLSAMLQSPHFLYLIEPNKGNGGRPLDSYEIAARLSYFIYRSGPDEVLKAAAKANGLQTDAQIKDQVLRMLANPKAHRAFIEFVEEWLSLDLIDGLQRSADHFPEFSPSLQSAMKEEILRNLFDLAFVEQNSLLDALKQESTWVNAELAQLYQLESASQSFAKVSLDKDKPRFGLLSQAGILAASSTSDETSPVGRGLFFQKKLLCTDIPPAPPDAGAFMEAEELPDNATPKQRFAAHTTNPSCATCHDLLDPFGLGLENYDALGRYRASYESGTTIDPSGSFHTASGKVPFSDVRELSTLLSEHDSVAHCLTRTLYQLGTARPNKQRESCEINRNHLLSAKANYSWPAMVLVTALSESFRNLTQSE